MLEKYSDVISGIYHDSLKRKEMCLGILSMFNFWNPLPDEIQILVAGLLARVESRVTLKSPLIYHLGKIKQFIFL